MEINIIFLITKKQNILGITSKSLYKHKTLLSSKKYFANLFEVSLHYT